MSSCTRISTSVRSSPPRALYFCVRVCTMRTPKGFLQCAGAHPPGLCIYVYFSAVRAQTTFVRCEPTKALCFGVLYELQELCAVRAYKGFLQPIMRIEDRLFDRGWVRSAMATRKCGNIYFPKYVMAVRPFLTSKIFKNYLGCWRGQNIPLKNFVRCTI